jgi:uncharacterized protein YecA (UPF0149 family)
MLERFDEIAKQLIEIPLKVKPEPAAIKPTIVQLESARLAKRNDLCICGSGIKYKKCCGRT